MSTFTHDRTLRQTVGFLLLLGTAALLVACSNESVDAGLPSPDPEEIQVEENVPSSVTSTTEGGSAEPGTTTIDAVLATLLSGERIIGSANLGGEIVDPKSHVIDDVMIAESYPEQLVVSFTAGDEPCTAATTVALASETQVRVLLEVGITTDALTRSCLAGQFPHSLTIPLAEGLDGRELAVEQPAEPSVDEPEAAPAPQPFESTLIGMSEGAAKDAVESFGYRWRVMAVDGEELLGTADYDERRVNVKLVDGTVTEAWLG